MKPFLFVLQRELPQQRWVWGAHVGSSFAEADLEVLLDTMDAPKEQQLGCLGKVPAAQPGRCLSSSLLVSSELRCTGANPAKDLKMVKGQEDLTTEGVLTPAYVRDWSKRCFHALGYLYIKRNP